MPGFSDDPVLARLRRRLETRLVRRAAAPAPATPSVEDFAREADEEVRASYGAGRAAGIFFANQGRTIHKWLHYLAIYDQLLEPYVGTAARMLEIGVFKGGSLGLWRKFLGDRAVVYGVDIDPGCARFDGETASVRIGSQDDPVFLRRVVAEMGGVDIVLDDGSHVASHQRASFEVLFPLLSEGGLYLIEDMHTAYWPSYEGGLKRPGTAVEFLKDKVDDMHRHYRAAGLNRADSMPDIESVTFFELDRCGQEAQAAPALSRHGPCARSARMTVAFPLSRP